MKVIPVYVYWILLSQFSSVVGSSIARTTRIIPIYRDNENRPLVAARIIQNGRSLARISQLSVKTIESPNPRSRSRITASYGLRILGESGEIFQIDSFQETTSMLINPVLSIWFGCELSRYVDAVGLTKSALTINPPMHELPSEGFLDLGYSQLQASLGFGGDENFSQSYPLYIAWGTSSPSTVPMAEFQRLSWRVEDLGGMIFGVGLETMIRAQDCYSRFIQELPNFHIRIGNNAELVFTPTDYLKATSDTQICKLLVGPESADDSTEFSVFPRIVLTDILLQHVGIILDYTQNRIAFFDPL